MTRRGDENLEWLAQLLSVCSENFVRFLRWQAELFNVQNRIRGVPALPAPRSHTQFASQPGQQPRLRRARVWIEQRIDYARPIIIGAMVDERGHAQRLFACVVAAISIVVLLLAWSAGVYHDLFLGYMKALGSVIGSNTFAYAFLLSFGFSVIWGVPMMFIPVFFKMFVREWGKFVFKANSVL